MAYASDIACVSSDIACVSLPPDETLGQLTRRDITVILIMPQHNIVVLGLAC